MTNFNFFVILSLTIGSRFAVNEKNKHIYLPSIQQYVTDQVVHVPMFIKALPHLYRQEYYSKQNQLSFIL